MTLRELRALLQGILDAYGRFMVTKEVVDLLPLRDALGACALYVQEGLLADPHPPDAIVILGRRLVESTWLADRQIEERTSARWSRRLGESLAYVIGLHEGLLASASPAPVAAASSDWVN